MGGRAWVSSLPIFFLGNSFQFWKLPPYLCINNMDNVYYPIFLGCYIIWKTNIKYTVICIAGIGLSVKMLSQNQRFSLGKARGRVFSLCLSTSPFQSIHNNNSPNHPQPLNQPTAHSTSTTRPALLFSHTTTRHHSIALRPSDFTRDATLHVNNINIPQHNKSP